jgi:hypothetical protein
METKLKTRTVKWLNWNQFLDWCIHYTGKLTELTISESTKPNYLQNHYYYLQNHYYYDSTISYPESVTNNDKIICAYYAEKGMWLVYNI